MAPRNYPPYSAAGVMPQTSAASHPQPIAPAPAGGPRPPVLRPIPLGGLMSQPPYGAANLLGTGNAKNNVVPVKDADGKFPCTHCTKTYLRAKDLKRHLLRHTGDRPYMCVLCRDTFSRSDILKRHFQKCSIRRGNPTGASHLSHPQAFFKKNAQAQKAALDAEGDVIRHNVLGHKAPGDSMAHPFGIVTVQDAMDNYASAQYSGNQEVSYPPPPARSEFFPDSTQRPYQPAGGVSSGSTAQQSNSPPMLQPNGRCAQYQDVPIDPCLAAPNPTYPQHSEEVPNAAVTLLENGNGPRRITHSSDGCSQRRPLGPQHQPLESFQKELRRGMNCENDNMFVDWVFPPPECKQSQTSTVRELQWGSDTNFSLTQAYRADVGGETVEAHRAEQMRFMDGLGTITEQNSPSAATHQQHPTVASHQEVKSSTKLQKELDAAPRKRRKGKVGRNHTGEDEVNKGTRQKSAVRKKNGPRSDKRISSPSGEVMTNGKRSRSTAGARKNLTKEQKRENHNKSEGKRRTLVKEGFDELRSLVPALDRDGLNKATMLSETASWLVELIKGNQELRAELGEC